MTYRLALTCLLALLFTWPSMAQEKNAAPAGKKTFSITGTLKDTLNFTATGYASVSLIRASDSILQTFTRTDEEGNFRLKADTPGKYNILIAHPSFAIYNDTVSVDKERTEMGTIIMISKKQLLDEVVITDARAVVIKKDTIEYTADSFKTRAYANVDELLKKLPGIEVDRSGKIKAYGKEVEKLTVDGEEFFSDDPAVVAQTLRASAVDKVQVFDKKSDQAAFTGVDDGELTKTINLKLKENAKQGYFGKISAGAGPPEYWENQAMINAFKKKRKLSAYGIMSNTNSNGLDWDDRGKYGSGNNFMENDNGDMTMVDGPDSEISNWDGQFGGQGLPKTWTGGGHYSNKWYGDTLSFNGSYQYAKNTISGFNNSRTQYILPDTQYINVNNTNNTSIKQRHSINTVTEYIIDTTSTVKLTLGGKYSLNDNSSTNYSASTALDGGKINEMSSMRQNRSESKSVFTNLLYRKRFKKKGRSFSANLSANWTENISNGLLRSDYTLYAIDSAYKLDQRKQNTSSTLTGNAKLSYTEPLSKVANLEVNYSLGINNNDAENSSFDRKDQGNEETDVFNPLFSSHYVFNTMQNQGGANLRFDFKRVDFSFGGNISNTSFTQEDKLFDTTYSYSYLNFFPRASLSFSKSQTTNINLRYNGRTRQPTIGQLQPLRNNNDPLNVFIGNPDLKQEFNHNFNISYNNYKMLARQSIYANASFSFVQNAISQIQYVDISGRRTYQYTNVNGNFNTGGYLSYGRKTLFDIYARAGSSFNYNRSNNFINGVSNVNNQVTLNPFLSINYYKDTTFDINYQFRPGYNMNTSSIRKDITTKYWTFQQELDGSITLPFQVTLGTSIDWSIRQRLDPQDKNNNVFRWNAYASKAFLKDRSLVAKVFAYDILNQNVGYTRTNNADYIAESTFNTIRRYFMFSLTWNFTKTGGAQKSADGLSTED